MVVGVLSSSVSNNYYYCITDSVEHSALTLLGAFCKFTHFINCSAHFRFIVIRARVRLRVKII